MGHKFEVYRKWQMFRAAPYSNVKNKDLTPFPLKNSGFSPGVFLQRVKPKPDC